MYAAVFVQAFTGVAASGCLRSQNLYPAGGTVGSSSIQPGSVTPTAGDVVSTGLGAAAASAPFTLDGAFALSDSTAIVSGVNFGGGAGYWVATSGSAVDPTWTVGTSDHLAASIAVFKGAPASAKRRVIVTH